MPHESRTPVRVLVVEDNAPTRALLLETLQEQGFAVEAVGTGREGVRRGLSGAFAVIVIDIQLPDLDGLAVCRELRESGFDRSILFLTARGEVSDRITGLDAGADDYLKKPFALAELNARIRALTRRRRPSPPSRLEEGNLSIDFRSRRMLKGGVEVPLTAREWQVLQLLADRPGEVVGRDEILDTAWPDPSRNASESLDVIMSRLRKKLRETPAVIRTVRGTGFLLEQIP